MDRLPRIEEKLDKVIEHISSIDSTLSAQHISLRDHIRRTELLEEKITPIEKSYERSNGVIKLFLFLAAIGAGIEGYFILLKHL